MEYFNIVFIAGVFGWLSLFSPSNGPNPDRGYKLENTRKYKANLVPGNAQVVSVRARRATQVNEDAAIEKRTGNRVGRNNEVNP
jgi:hypothetical protein